MAQRKLRIVLLSQDRQLVELVREALGNAQSRTMIDIREAALLPPALDRGTDLLVIDLSLPDKMLASVAGAIGELRHLPVLVLASQADDWDRFSPGNPLETVAEFPFTTTAIAAAANGLLEKAAFLLDRLVGG